MRIVVDCAWMLDGTTNNCVHTLSLASRGYSRFAGLKAVECSKSLPSESILLSVKSIRFWTESKVWFLNRFAFASSQLYSVLNRFEVLSNVFIRLCHRNRVESGYSGIDSTPTEIEKHVSTILERRDMQTIGSSKRERGSESLSISLILGFSVMIYEKPPLIYEINVMKDRLRSGPDDWSSRKYERWLSGASSGSVGLGYDNRPSELILAYRNRIFRYRFKLGKLAKRSFGFLESSIFRCGCVEN
ncbi:hypothetical protein PIB30_066005 [Stylosanthes scabra]|uniref:Maturase K n=1 Tax=Stylosanthes scabra TaxID=79078 RepID=A0ABU6TLY1_9FABA|nr:hypothetical protein [Stylosanthes scabra]